jgi:hypothetical protein
LFIASFLPLQLCFCQSAALHPSLHLCLFPSHILACLRILSKSAATRSPGRSLGEVKNLDIATTLVGRKAPKTSSKYEDGLFVALFELQVPFLPRNHLQLHSIASPATSWQAQ